VAERINTLTVIEQVESMFSRIYLGGIPSLLNDDGAFLSFSCVLTGVEALGGFLDPTAQPGQRFKSFITKYFPNPYPAQTEALWQLRNALVHAFSTGPYSLTHHNGHKHLAQVDGCVTLNAENMYATLVLASRQYFEDVRQNPEVQAAFLQRASDPDAGVLVVTSTGHDCRQGD
jgi:hypothetical protein